MIKKRLNQEPLYDAANELGFDLQQMVLDNPEFNCTQLFIKEVKRQLDEKISLLKEDLNAFSNIIRKYRSSMLNTEQQLLFKLESILEDYKDLPH
jgi:hypothetical protein